MAVVTDLQYALENRLIEKLDIMIERCARDKVEKDALLINEGAEGEGKTNSSVCEAYYIKQKLVEKYKLNREIHLFFRLQAMVNFAKSTEKKIIIWDEPALDSLKKDSVTSMNKMLERLLMTCRIKRHFFIFNLTKFHKFSEYIVVDRCLGLVHMFSRKEIIPGRFIYVKKHKLEALYQTYLSKKKRTYKENKSFGGSFPEIMKENFEKMQITVEGFPNTTYAQYNQIKMNAIMSIGESLSGMGKRELQTLKKLIKLRKKIAEFPIRSGIDNERLAQMLDISSSRLREWRKIDENNPLLLENEGFEGADGTNIVNFGQGGEKIQSNTDGFANYITNNKQNKLIVQTDN